MKAKCKNYGMEWAYLDESMVEYSDMGEEICPQCKTAILYTEERFKHDRKSI